MENLYNIEVTQGTKTPVLEADIYTYETLLFYLNRFNIYEQTEEFQRLMNGDKVLIATYQNEVMAIKLINYTPLNENQAVIVKGLKWCAIFAALISLFMLFFFNNFKLLIILLPNAGLLWLTSKKLSVTSSNDFDLVLKKVLIILIVAMISFAGLAIYII